ncbi:MAG: hypothetical protein GY830_00165 [Bacteroidetes bacterium]|nr:hypothetical protein [Bacteroidota bacterium]
MFAYKHYVEDFKEEKIKLIHIIDRNKICKVISNKEETEFILKDYSKMLYKNFYLKPIYIDNNLKLYLHNSIREICEIIFNNSFIILRMKEIDIEYFFNELMNKGIKNIINNKDFFIFKKHIINSKVHRNLSKSLRHFINELLISFEDSDYKKIDNKKSKLLNKLKNNFDII